MSGDRRKLWTGRALAAVGMAVVTPVAMLFMLSLSIIPCVRADVRQGLSFSPPFNRHDHKGARFVPSWQKQGSTSIMQSFVRITPDKPDQVGALWTKLSLGADEFSLEWKFRISGSQKTGFGDSFALIISHSNVYKAGRFFGFIENFIGLAIVVNTNRNSISLDGVKTPRGRHRDLSIVLNNGTRTYEDLISNAEGCSTSLRYDEGRDDFNVMRASRVRLKFVGSTVSMEVDSRNNGRWRRCATLAHVDMPTGWATKCSMGMVAQTSQATNNHDLLGLQVFNSHVDAWELDLSEESEDELDSLVHHMEHELFGVHDSLQDTIAQLKTAEEEAEGRLAKLEESLSKNMMKALEQRVANLEVQVQTSLSRSLSKHADKVYGQLEEGVGETLNDKVGKMSGSWHLPFFGLLGVVFVMVVLSITKYKELKKQHLL